MSFSRVFAREDKSVENKVNKMNKYYIKMTEITVFGFMFSEVAIHIGLL